MKIDPTGLAQQGLEGAADKTTDQGKGSRGFGKMLEDAAARVNHDLVRAEELSARLAAGEPVDIAQTMIAISKADIQFRLMVQVRNKALGAYEEIMRMQV